MTRFVDRRLAAIEHALDTLILHIADIQQQLAALDGANLPEDERTRQRDALNGQIAQSNHLQTQLGSEQIALQSAKPVDIDDLTYQLAAVAFLGPLTAAGPILTLLQQDPVIATLGNGPLLTSAQELAIINVPKSAEQLAFSPLTYLANVQATLGNGDAFDQLVTAAHHQWFMLPLEGRPYFYNDFGVLLPVRLETLFEQHQEQDDMGQEVKRWTMYLRIIPDEASIRRDNPVVTDLEISSLQEMWQDIYTYLDPSDKAKHPVDWLDTPRGKTEWQIMCNRFGGARATWLTSTYPPDVTDGTITIHAQVGADAPPPNRVGSFPNQIEIWIGYQGQKATLATTTSPIKTSELTFDVLGSKDKQGPNENKDAWWIFFDAAKAVGLGVEYKLPANRGPEDITILYVVGMSDETPTKHFQAQIDAGEMAIMKLGEPTNTVDGKPAADLAKDAETWLRVVKQRLRGTTSYLSAPLTGQDNSLSALPDTNTGSVHSYSTDLVRALWPALWGHFLKDIWGQGENAHLVGLWACAENDAWTLPNLCPEGPLPPIRVNDQPYALLPTSSLQRWTVTPEEGKAAQLENRLRDPFLLLRRYWAAQARSKGNVVGKDTTHLLDIITHDALTDHYIYRIFLPSQYFEYIYEGKGLMTRAQFFSWLERLFAPAYKMMNTQPRRHYIANGDYLNLHLPLITPLHWPESFYTHDDRAQPILAMKPSEAFGKIIQSILQDGYRIPNLRQDFRLTLPDSLLIRLLIYAHLHSVAAVVQADNNDQTPLLEPLVNSKVEETKIDKVISQITGGILVGKPYNPGKTYTTNAGKLHTILKDAFQTLTMLYELSPEQLERSLRATLDTASHRIDPWITGFAWRRLKHVGRTTTARFSMGVYGWIDGPILGKPGPTKGGLLHALSYPQAVTSVILRDKFLSEQVEGGARNPWDMQLESNVIRMAEELAEETRIGSHIHEALGRRVERIIGTHEGVKVLRATFPLRPKQPEANVVCHGLDALHGLLDAPPPIILSLKQQDALLLLRRAVNAYSDLLVAEAVHQVVTGHGDIAGAAMDAAAGLGKPPNLEVIRTPASGYSLNTSVIAVIPFKETDDNADASRSPGRVADASVAAFLETLLGTADAWQWSVAGGGTIVRLSDLQLEPIDTVMLSKDWLEDCVYFQLGIEKSVEIKLQGNGIRNHVVAREVVKVLAGQPALLRDINTLSNQNAAEIIQLDIDILTELKKRYTRITDAARSMLVDFHEAVDEQKRKQALRSALRWGITPTVTQDEKTALFAALFHDTDPQDITLLTRLVTQAAESLQKRLDTAPTFAPDQPAPGTPEQLNKLKQVQEIAVAIAELSAPEGQLAILSKIGTQKLQATTAIATADVDTTLESDWLNVVASVRPSLARLEAIQLATKFIYGLRDFATWSNTPQDHWQLNIIAENERKRVEHPGSGIPAVVIPHFVAAFSAGDIWAQADATSSVAVSLIDSWSEGLPGQTHVTTAAAGFAAPIARPPQAILLAVPPELRKPLDTQALIDIIDETRELAHARAIVHKDVQDYLSIAPSMQFDATGTTGIKLAPDTTFPQE